MGDADDSDDVETEVAGIVAHARILLNLGRKAEALREATKAVRLDRHWSPALHLLALCQMEMFDYEAARQTAALAVEVDPRDPLTHRTEGELAYFELPFREEPGDGAPWDAAERAFRKALELEPHDAGVALRLASVLQRRGRTIDALRMYLSVAQRNPANAAAVEVLSTALHEALFIKIRWNDVGEVNWHRIDYMECPAVTELLCEVREFTRATRAKVDEALTAALKMLADAAESIDGESRRWAWEYPDFAARSMGAMAMAKRWRTWGALDFEDDPVPVEWTMVRDAADDFTRSADKIVEFADRVRTLARPGSEMFIENDGLPVNEMLAGVCANLDPLVALHRACGEILRRFAKRLWHVDRQLTAAVDWAEHAEDEIDDRRGPIPVSPPSDVPQSAAEEQRLLRDQLEAIAGYNADYAVWEDERQHAIRLANQAVDRYREAESDCVTALRATVDFHCRERPKPAEQTRRPGARRRLADRFRRRAPE